MRSIMLCYNLKGTKKGRKIGMLGSFLGFRVKYVEKEEYSKDNRSTDRTERRSGGRSIMWKKLPGQTMQKMKK